MRWLLWLVCTLTSVTVAAAPDVTLKDLAGRERNVNEFIGRGKWVAVTVWAHDCGVCAAEIHEMADFHRARKDRDALVLGVSIDGYDQRKQAEVFIKRHNLPFTNLIAEPSQEVILKFGAGELVGTPTTYLYNPSGRLAAMTIGPVSRNDIESYIERNTPEGEPEHAALGNAAGGPSLQRAGAKAGEDVVALGWEEISPGVAH